MKPWASTRAGRNAPTSWSRWLGASREASKTNPATKGHVMLEIVGFIGLSLLLLIGAILALAARRPDTFRTARTALIGSSPERLFPLINDLRQMNTWNPYALRDAAVGTTTYRGPASGKGAGF